MEAGPSAPLVKTCGEQARNLHFKARLVGRPALQRGTDSPASIFQMPPDMTASTATAGQDRTPAAEWWWAAGVALLWTLVLVAIPPTPFKGLDFARFCDPAIHLLRTSLLNGEMPWWNPYSSLGRPFAADMQTSSFYPTTYLSVFFGTSAGWMIATVAHGILAVWGFARLMSWIGVARPAAWGGAAIFLFSAPLLARMQAGQVPYVYAICYLPLVLWLAARLAVSPTRQHWAALALAWGLQLLCSHPQVSWLSALGAGAFVTGRLLQPPWGAALRAWLRAALALATACACGMALLGFVVVPFVELIGQSNRAAPSLAFSAKFAMGLDHWISLVAAPSDALAFNWEYDAHVGAVALIGGMVALARWRDPVMRGLALMILAGAVIASGTSTPLFALLYKALPGLASFRIPARAAALVAFGLISGAARLAGSKLPERRTRGTVLLAGLMILAVMFFFYSRRMSAGGEVATRWLYGQLTAVSAAMVAWWLWLGRDDNDKPALAWVRRLVLPAAIALELCLAVSGLKHLPILPAQFPAESVVAAAIHARGLDRQVAPVRVCLPATLMRENSGMIYRYATLTGFESLSLSRIWTYLHRAAGADPNHAFNTSPDGRVYETASRMGSVNLSVSLPAGSSVLTINPSPDPRAYLATQFTPVPDAHAAITLMLARHLFHEDALVEQPVPAGLTLGPAPGPGTATITRFTLNSLEVTVESPGAALLVVAEAWYPGWRASIAGRKVACLPVNGWMRGVPVPAGHSVVRLTYHQNGLVAGAGVSLVAIFVLARAWRSRVVPAPGPVTW
jgi:hypothetical protein